MPHEILAVVANPGNCILASTKPGVILNEKASPNRAEHFTSAEALHQRAAELSALGCDLYFTPATFLSRTRTAKNAKSAQALWIDIDVRPDKGFSTHAEAADGIAKFLADTKLPQPTIINSGAGLHLYWVCKESFAPKVWQGYAKTLHMMVKHHGGGIASDTARITDITSLMRLPGYKNHKRGAMASIIFIAPTIDRATFDTVFNYDRAVARFSAVAPTNANAPASFVLGQLPTYLTGQPSTNPVASPAPAATTNASLPATGFVLGQLPAYLGGTGAATPPPSLPAGRHDSLGNDSSKPTYAQLLANCAVIRYGAANPNDVPEPEWKYGLNAIMQTQDGLMAAHIYSRGYDGYSSEETTEKATRAMDFDRPVSCDTIRGVSTRSYLCTTCKNKGRGASPVKGAVRHVLQCTAEGALEEVNRVLAIQAQVAEVQAAQATPQSAVAASSATGGWNIIPLNPNTQCEDASIVLPMPPVGYMFGTLTSGKSGVFTTSDMNTPIIPDLVWVDRMLVTLDDSGIRRSGYRIHHLDTYGHRNTHYLMGDRMGKRSLEGFLLETGMGASTVTVLADYVLAACEVVRSSRGTPLYIIESYGWFRTGGLEVFVTPHSAVDEHGNHLEIVSGNTSSIREVEANKSGVLSEWINAVDVLYSDNSAAHFFLLVSLASPLINLVRDDGKGMNAFSVFLTGYTGVGKSMLSRVCQSVWTGPDKLTQGSSTLNALPQVAAMYRQLPMFVDDFVKGSYTAEQMKDAILGYVQGEEKTRLGKDGKRQTPATWSNVMFVSTNIQVSDILDGGDDAQNAGRARMFEYRMPPYAATRNNDSIYTDAKAAIYKNCEVMGREYSSRLMRTGREELGRRIRREDAAATAAVSALNARTASEKRFATKMVACCAVAYELLADILPFDGQDAITWAINRVAHNVISDGTTAMNIGDDQKLSVLKHLRRILVRNQSYAYRAVVVPAAVATTMRDVAVRDDVLRAHNENLMHGKVRPHVITMYDYSGVISETLISTDLIAHDKSVGMALSTLTEALGAPEDGMERVVRKNAGTLISGTAHAIATKYLRLTATETMKIETLE